MPKFDVTITRELTVRARIEAPDEPSASVVVDQYLAGHVPAGSFSVLYEYDDPLVWVHEVKP